MADNHLALAHANVNHLAVFNTYASLLLVLLLPHSFDDVEVH